MLQDKLSSPWKLVYLWVPSTSNVPPVWQTASSLQAACFSCMCLTGSTEWRSSLIAQCTWAAWCRACKSTRRCAASILALPLYKHISTDSGLPDLFQPRWFYDSLQFWSQQNWHALHCLLLISLLHRVQDSFGATGLAQSCGLLGCPPTGRVLSGWAVGWYICLMYFLPARV